MEYMYEAGLARVNWPVSADALRGQLKYGVQVQAQAPVERCLQFALAGCEQGEGITRHWAVPSEYRCRYVYRYVYCTCLDGIVRILPTRTRRAPSRRAEALWHCIETIKKDGHISYRTSVATLLT